MKTNLVRVTSTPVPLANALTPNPAVNRTPIGGASSANYLSAPVTLLVRRQSLVEKVHERDILRRMR
jgi:hypothetical protein